tara:strand:+ start:92 stop:388 length:297 start_codon:yes stop_codon:yes gene_type:complete
MQLLYFSLAAAGLTQILVYGKIFDKIRPTQGWMGQLLSCPMCTGFWSGLFLWSVSPWTELFTFDISLVTAMSMGCIGSLVSYIFGVTFSDFGINIDSN